MLHIQLLGAPVVVDHTQNLVRITRRILRAMFFYLACQTDPTGRSDLILLFWPDESEGKARRMLRETLSKLRAQLPDPEILCTGQDQVWLDHSKIRVDVLEFLELYEEIRLLSGRISNSRPLPEPLVRRMTQAVALWRAPHFMTGASLFFGNEFEHWYLMTSRKLEEYHLTLLERLADHATASGDLEDGLRWIRLALDADEFNTELHYRLINGLVNLGRRSEALSHFNSLQELFGSEEAGVLPAYMQEIYQKLNQPLPDPAIPYPYVFWPNSLGLHVPLVGRRRELANLERAYQRGGTAVVLGEAGIGKTRLIYELAQILRPAVRLVIATCRPLETNLPFQPIIDLIRSSVSGQELHMIPSVWRAQLTQLTPELTILDAENSPLVPSDSPDEVRTHLFEALHQLFLVLSQAGRILFVLDDAQWCDEATLSLLAYLIERNFFNRRGLLILAARAESISPYLENFFQQIEYAHSPLRVPLEQLTSDETASLARAVLGSTPQDEIVERLVNDTGGNPLFLLETLRTVLEIRPNLEEQQALDRLPIAGSIQNVVQEMLRQMSPTALQVLSLAAIFGREFSPHLLEAATRLEPEALVQALEELERHHLIRYSPSPNGTLTYGFVHNKIREVLLGEQSPARLRLLHLRAARALEQLYGRDRQYAAVLARHYEAADERRQAFDCWLNAAQHARRLFARTEAYYGFMQAQAILSQMNYNLPEESIYHLYSSWGQLAIDFCDTEAMHQIFTTALNIGKTHQSPLLTGCALNGLAETALQVGQLDKAQGLIELAMFYLEQSEYLYERILAYNRLGAILSTLNHNTLAIEPLQKSLQLSKNNRDARLVEARIQTGYKLGMVYIRLGQPDEAVKVLQESLLESQYTFYTPGEMWSYGMLAYALYYLGQYENSLEHIETALPKAEAFQNWRLAGYMYL
ncbi:MAG: AAA family ATPase, partial [Chloroflexi bacterium]|nr:AAA family ATPase [Chloroflexota bacterium]